MPQVHWYRDYFLAFFRSIKTPKESKNAPHVNMQTAHVTHMNRPILAHTPAENETRLREKPETR